MPTPMEAKKKRDFGDNGLLEFETGSKKAGIQVSSEYIFLDIVGFQTLVMKRKDYDRITRWYVTGAPDGEIGEER